jgi:hypothetical protein
MSRLHPGAFTEVEQLEDELAALGCALRHYGLEAEDREQAEQRVAEVQARLVFLSFWGVT